MLASSSAGVGQVGLEHSTSGTRPFVDDELSYAVYPAKQACPVFLPWFEMQGPRLAPQGWCSCPARQSDRLLDVAVYIDYVSISLHARPM